MILDDGQTIRGAGPFYSILRGFPQPVGSRESVGVYGNQPSADGVSLGVGIFDLCIEVRAIVAMRLSCNFVSPALNWTYQ